jgi:hypothetical protein
MNPQLFETLQKRGHFLAGTFLFGWAASTSSAYVLVKDFEDGVLGDDVVVVDQFGTGSLDVIADPTAEGDPENMLAVYRAGTQLNNNFTFTLPLPVDNTIDEGSKGTVFMRFATDRSLSNMSASFGISPVDAPVTGSTTRWEFGHSNALVNPTSAGALNAYDGSGYKTAVGSLADQTWFKLWIIPETGSDTYSVYLQGGDYAEPTLVAEDFAFRRDATRTQGLEDLKTLWFWASSGDATPARDGLIYIDDIYVEDSSATLVDPVPNAAPMAYKPSLVMYPREASIAIDGVKESAYRTSSAYGFVDLNGSVEDAADLSASYSAAFDDEGIYLFFDVTDDVFSADGPFSYDDDGIELRFDPDDDDGSAYDLENDVIISVAPQSDGTVLVAASTFRAPTNGNPDFTDLAGAVVLGTTGYTAEVFVPWAGLQIDPMGDWRIGFSYLVNDDDGDAINTSDNLSRRTGQYIWALRGNLNQAPALFGDLYVAAPKKTEVQSSGGAITIDGTKEAAYRGMVNVIERWQKDPHPTDTSATWQMVYDEENLYFFLSVVDDAVVTDSPDQPWADDGVEVFFDGNNNKDGAHDGVDDVKISFVLDDQGGVKVLAEADVQFPDPPIGTDFSGLEASVALTATGWDLEAKVPLSVIKLTPTPGKAFGIDVVIKDDDDGGAADGDLAWCGGGNNRTDRYGTATIYAPSETWMAPTDTAITLDGEIDDAYLASPFNELDRTPGGSFHTPLGNDASGYWVGVYDSDYVYLIIDLADDDISVDSPTQVWNDDGLELLFDPSNDATEGQPFDQVEDIKISIILQPGMNPDLLLVTDAPVPKLPPNTDFTGLEAAWVETALGWRVEVKVPFAALRKEALVGLDMGMEIAFQDDDFGGNRDHIVLWSTIGNSNSNPAMFGTVYLGGDNPLFSTIIDATLVEGMTYDSWMGQFSEDPAHDGWIVSEGLGWMYAGGVQVGSQHVWLYSYTLDTWVYTRVSIAPLFFVQGTGWTYYFYDEANSQAWLYVYASGSWQAVDLP